MCLWFKGEEELQTRRLLNLLVLVELSSCSLFEEEGLVWHEELYLRWDLRSPLSMSLVVVVPGRFPAKLGAGLSRRAEVVREEPDKFFQNHSSWRRRRRILLAAPGVDYSQWSRWWSWSSWLMYPPWTVSLVSCLSEARVSSNSSSSQQLESLLSLLLCFLSNQLSLSSCKIPVRFL